LPGWDHCLKVNFDNGEWFHNRHLNIYIWQSQTFSQNIQTNSVTTISSTSIFNIQ
jgi:hypothetical protein